jgi:hypothetical protein
MCCKFGATLDVRRTLVADTIEIDNVDVLQIWGNPRCSKNPRR